LGPSKERNNKITFFAGIWLFAVTATYHADRHVNK